MIDMDLLKIDTLTDLINEFEPEGLVFQNSGVLPTRNAVGEEVSWDVLGVDRDIDKFEHRGGSATPRKLQILRRQNARLAYTFKSKDIPGEIVMDLRRPGSLERQQAGEDQIGREEQDFRDLMDRQDEFMLAGALQGAFTIKIDDIDVTVDYGVPNSNKFNIGGTGGQQSIPLNWEDLASDQITDLKNIKLAASRNSGHMLDRAFCSARVATSIIKNDNFKVMFGGTDQGAQILRTGFIGRFWGFDWFQADHTFLNSAGVATPYLDEKKVVFTPRPNGRWGWFQRGSIVIPRGDGGAFEERLGRVSYSKAEWNPPGITLFAAYRRLPVISIPTAIVIAQVIP